jgi:hypothetical protein
MSALRRLALWLLPWLALAALLPAAPARGEAERPALMYFYENYCQSCSPEQDFVRDFYRLTGRTTDPYDCAFYNVSQARNKALMEEVIREYHLPEGRRGLPLLIVDGKAYAGADEIGTELPRDVLSRDGASGESVVYYLYVSGCESCARAKTTVDALPASVDVRRGGYAFSSPVRVERVDIGAQTGLALALFDEYRVPDDRRFAPIAFVRDRYFAGADAIERDLSRAVGEGEAVGNAIRVSGARPLPGAEIGPAALAGWVGGLNPCALSMLLLFISMLLPMKRRAGLCAAAFLASKFATYLLIGTLLLAAMQAWDPSWLAPALKFMLTAYCVALMLLNLWDAWNARKERYGRIKNQLPPRMRGWLRRRISAVMDHPARLIPAVVALGALVAASEFLCAGQVYLAALLAGMKSGWRSLPALLAYCAAFIAPSAAIAAVVLRGKSSFEVSDWILRRMPLVKLLTALFFAGVLAYVWMSH